MAQDLRKKRVSMPVIPSSEAVRKRLREVQTEAAKLDILLRLAIELEEADRPTTDHQSEGNANA